VPFCGPLCLCAPVLPHLLGLALTGCSWSVKPSCYSWLNPPPLPSFIMAGTTGGFLSIFCQFFWSTMLLPIPEVWLHGLFSHFLQIFSSNYFQAAADQWSHPVIAGWIPHHNGWDYRWLLSIFYQFCRHLHLILHDLCSDVLKVFSSYHYLEAADQWSPSVIDGQTHHQYTPL
jgi:hypothetical protein